MASPPPPAPIPTPDIPGLGVGVTTLSVDTWVGLFVNALLKHPGFEFLLEKATGAMAPEWIARATGFHPEVLIRYIRANRSVQERFRREAEPFLLEFAVDGINQYFGTHIGPDSLRERGLLGKPGGTETQIGRSILTALFQNLEHPVAIDAETGWNNMQAVLTFAVKSSIEEWLVKNLDAAVIHEFFPQWGELGDIVSKHIAIDRLMRRVLAPLLNILVVEPTTRRINKTFLPAFLNETQAVRAFNTGFIAEAEFFSIMAEHGWPRERAALLRVINGKGLSESDIQNGREVGALTETEALRALGALGYNPDLAKKQFEIIELQRIRQVEETVANVARDMFRDREISEAEYRSALKAAGKSDEETAGFLGLGRIERSRPQRLSRAAMEDAFVAGWASLDRLRRYYTLEGFSFEDQLLLEQMVLKRKLDAETKAKKAPPPPPAGGGAPLPKASADELHRVGILTDEELATAYTQLGFAGARVGLLLRLAQRHREEFVAAEAKRAAPPPAAVAPRDAIEQAFIRGIVDEGRLRAFYVDARLTAADVETLVGVLLQRRAEFERRRADEEERRKRAAAPPPRPLPQAAAEEAHRVGLTTTATLTAAYRALNYTPAAVEQLVALAERRRAEFVDAERRRQEPPPAAEVSRSTEEQAFLYDLVDEQQLGAYYAGQGYDADDVELLLELARIRKAAADAAAAARQDRAPAQDTKARA